MNTKHQNAYKRLNLPRTADWKQAKTQYRRLVQTCHPDKFDSGSIESAHAHEMFLEINKAFDVLQDFYRENRKLPLEPDTLSDTDFTELQQKRHRGTKKASRKHKRNKASKGTASKLSFVFGLAMIIFLLFNSSRESSGPINIEGDILVNDVSPNNIPARSSSWNTQLGGDLSRGQVLGVSPKNASNSGLNGRLFERQR